MQVHEDSSTESTKQFVSAVAFRKKSQDTILFLDVHCQIPMLCRSPQYDVTKPLTPVLSFVLPTIHTLNTLQEIVHETEATKPVGMIGKQTPKLIRAYDEIAANEKARLSLRDTQKSLLKLYPSAKLQSPSRPIELTHPDVQKTESPHDVNCYDFLLSWHDLFHAWRNGANYKTIIRNLRYLHDDKAGFAVNKPSMSKVIWTLSDLDLSMGRILREGTTSVGFICSAFFHLLEPGSILIRITMITT